MRLTTELCLLLLAGLFLGLIGPFGTTAEPFLARLVFWLFLIPAGGLAAILIERLLGPAIATDWLRGAAAAALVTPPLSFLVVAAMILFLRHDHGLALAYSPGLLAQIFVISLAVMLLRSFVRRPPVRIVETVIAPPLPGAESTFRGRLSAQRRGARLIALEAHDHYVRVHTDAGVELIAARLSDLVSELSGAHGFRVHRSWWVAGEAIKAGRWRRGRGELELDGGLRVPVSRSGAPALRAAGWL